jgi:6-pyruvoyltetrahydropterin/6-carboxytetrahydropterin synthase
MTFELSKQFRFEAAHTLARAIDAEPSRRIHGHSYRAEVTVRGPADPATGKVADLGPATMENLAAWIWRRVSPTCPNLKKVTVYRDSEGDACSYFGPEA